MSIFRFLYALINYFITPDTPLIRVLTHVYTLFFILLWAILKTRFRNQVPKLGIVYFLSWNIFAVFSFYDLLPNFLRETNRMRDDEIIIICLFIFNCMNYNSFLTTLLFIPPITLIPYYFQLVKEAELWTDPFTGIPLTTQDDRDNFVW